MNYRALMEIKNTCLIAGCEQRGYLWLRVKRYSQLISSTSMGIVLGLDKYNSRHKLLQKHIDAKYIRFEKIKDEEKKRSNDDFFQRAVQYGIKYEKDAIDTCCNYMTYMLDMNITEQIDLGTYICTESCVSVSPDKILVVKNEEGDQILCGLEVKVPFVKKNIPGSIDEIRASYLSQCFTCLMTMKMIYWYLYFYDPDDIDCYILFRMKPDKSLWEEDILPLVCDFYERVDTDKPFPRKSDKDKEISMKIHNRLKKNTELIMRGKKLGVAMNIHDEIYDKINNEIKID